MRERDRRALVLDLAGLASDLRRRRFYSAAARVAAEAAAIRARSRATWPRLDTLDAARPPWLPRWVWRRLLWRAYVRAADADLADVLRGGDRSTAPVTED